MRFHGLGSLVRCTRLWEAPGPSDFDVAAVSIRHVCVVGSIGIHLVDRMSQNFRLLAGLSEMLFSSRGSLVVV